LLPIPELRVKKAPDPGSATLTNIVFYIGFADPYSFYKWVRIQHITLIRIRARIQKAK
jgi:hypothetical protein